jgi:hypothetical protein
VWDYSVRNTIPLRMSAYKVAVDRLVKAKKMRGVFP